MLDDYERELDSLVEMSAARREPRLRRLDAELRRPAQADLASLPGDAGPAVESLRATLAHDPFAEWVTRFEASRSECARTIRDAEPCRLAGDAAMREARRAMFEGRHRDARGWLAKAGAQYHDALQIARSDPGLHRRACGAASMDVTVSEWLQPGDVAADVVAAAQQICSGALLVSPDDPRVVAMAAKLAAQVAGDDRDRLRAAVELAERAVTAAPNDVEVLALAAATETRLGEQLLYGAARAPKELDRAAELLRRAAALLPDRADLPAKLALLLLRNRFFADTAAELAEASRRCEASNALAPDNLWTHDCRAQIRDAEASAAREAGRSYRHLYDAIIEEAAATARRFPDDALAQQRWADRQLTLALELEEDRQPDLALARGAVEAMRQYVRRFPQADDAWLLDTAEVVLASARATVELADPRPALSRLLQRGLRPDERAADAENLGHAELVVLDWCSAMALPCADWRARAMRDVAALDRATTSRPRATAIVVDLALALAQLSVDDGRDPTPLLRRVGAILDEDSSLQRTVRPRRELIALRWLARRNPGEAVTKARAFVASLRPRASEGSLRAKLAEMIAEAHCLVAAHSTDETDRLAARQSVAEYAGQAPADRLHSRRLQRLLSSALGR